MQSLADIGNAKASGASPSVVSAIKQASAESGVDFSYLMQKASTESSFNPTAKAATSSASGLYQFIDQTWLNEIAEHGAQYGLSQQAAAVSIDGDGHAYVSDPAVRKEILSLKNDPKIAAEMAAEFTKDNKQYLQQTVGGQIGGTELYLAHFLGAGGAAKFLTAMKANPNQSGASVMPAAADFNEPVFYHADGSPRSLGEIYNRFAARFGGSSVSVSASTNPNVSSSSYIGAYSQFSSNTVSVPNTGIASATATTDDNSTPGSIFASQNRASMYEMLILSQLNATQSAAYDKAVKSTLTPQASL